MWPRYPQYLKYLQVDCHYSEWTRLERPGQDQDKSQRRLTLGNIGRYSTTVQQYNSTTVQHTPIWIYLILYSHKLQVWNCLLSSTLENLGEGVERETLQPGEDQDQQRDHVGPPQPQQQLRGGVRAELPRPGETQHPARAQQSASQQSHEVILLWRGRWWAGGLVGWWKVPSFYIKSSNRIIQQHSLSLSVNQ